MKRFWLFCWYWYYPSGAEDDFEKDFDSEQECLDYLKTKDRSDDNAVILDMQERKWISVSRDLLSEW